MKTAVKNGVLFLVSSLILSSIYLNCSGNNMDPIPMDGKTDDLNSTGFNQGTCTQNGAINPPFCTINVFQQCISGATNPPDCTTGIPANTCSNSAVNPPQCTVGANGLCIAGANNPPTCTTFNNCENGALDYPACTPPTPGVFDVFVKQSGPLSKYSLKIDMTFNAADEKSKGAIFLVAQKPKPEKPSETLTMICTNPCSDTSWKEWNDDPSVDWSISGVKTQVGAGGLLNVYNRTGDFTAVGGYKIFAGYGLGETARAAVHELLSYRSSSYPSGRYQELLTIPIQSMSFSLSGPTGGSVGPLTTYDLWGYISPSTADYGKQGYFFVLAHNTDNTIKHVYRPKASGGFEWVVWDGNPATLGDKFFKTDTQIKNESFSIYKGDATTFVGWSVYIGYGLGTNPTEAGTDCINNNKFNSGNPFIVK